jgi:hypothetical protein
VTAPGANTEFDDPFDVEEGEVAEPIPRVGRLQALGLQLCQQQQRQQPQAPPQAAGNELLNLIRTLNPGLRTCMGYTCNS